jgi:hypothetical protein
MRALLGHDLFTAHAKTGEEFSLAWIKAISY